jgi:flotillin
MTLNPKCDSVETAEGVAVTVTGVAQVKVMQGDFLATACEQFLGRTTREIESVILQTLEGHLRAILGTLTVEEIYKGTHLWISLIVMKKMFSCWPTLRNVEHEIGLHLSILFICI